MPAAAQRKLEKAVDVILAGLARVNTRRALGLAEDIKNAAALVDRAATVHEARVRRLQDRLPALERELGAVRDAFVSEGAALYAEGLASAEALTDRDRFKQDELLTQNRELEWLLNWAMGTVDGMREELTVKSSCAEAAARLNHLMLEGAELAKVDLVGLLAE
jgi:hypothetical protein